MSISRMRAGGPGEYREHLGRRKGRVQEKADLASPAAASQLVGERQHVEVLDPHQVAFAKQRHERLGVHAVDLQVRAVGFTSDDDLGREAVQQRPEGPVAEVVVEEVRFAAVQVDGGKLDSPERRDRRSGGSAPPDGSPAPAEPQTASLLQGGAHGADQPSNGHGPLLLPGGRRIDRWQPVGDHD